MKRTIALYIGGKRADLADDSFVLLNYAFNDLTNPAIVRNSYSQQITLPATAANVAIFSEFGRLDRITGGGYDALSKMPFSIYSDNGDEIHSGYVRLDGITRNGGLISQYQVTLFGGLGSLFYGLSYRPDGTKMTLGDLYYSDEDGNSYDKDSEIEFDIAYAWDILENDIHGDIHSIFNFAPMYNGLPESFSSNKAIVLPGTYDNLPSYLFRDGVWYEPKGGTTAPYIVTFPNKHTEWDMAELRTYLQRPIVRIHDLLNAIADSAYDLTGKRLIVDASVRGDSYLASSWMTLPMIPEKYRSYSSITLGELLENTMSPADFLIGIAKVLGLVFETDHDITTVMTRDEYFGRMATTSIDLTERVDAGSDIKVTPVFAESHYYDFALTGIGEGAKIYKQQTGREYGSVRVDTNYPFNDDVKAVWDGVPFKTADFMAMQSASFISDFFQNEGDEVTALYLPQSASETIKAQMYKVAGGTRTEESSEIELPVPSGKIVKDAPNYYDWLPKVESQEEGGKAADGSGLLLFFVGFRNTPVPEYDDAEGTSIVFPAKRYYITDYDASRIELNGGEDCWDLRHTGAYLTSLPSFEPSNEWRSFYPAGVYNAMWRDYIRDVYDRDSQKMTCKVNLRGLGPAHKLLSRFFWYGGALWVLNRINNYSLTTYDPADCEFIRVQDTLHYTNAQF